jgi:hypothetical protein
MPRLSDEQVYAAIQAAEADSIGPESTEVASDRADAIDRYLGKPYGDELTGRSQVISRDVSDVVEGVLANVLKPFVAGDEIVRFDPRGPEDEDAAQQETDYVNFIALERNNGFLVLNAAVKDALLLRNGYVKCGWRVRQDVILETYKGQTDDELALLMQDPDIKVVEHSEYPDLYAAPPPQQPSPAGVSPGMTPGGGMGPPPMLHDVTVQRTRPTEYVEIKPVPPDEIRVSQRATGPCLQDCDFVQHRTRVSLSYLREMGYKVKDDIEDDDDSSGGLEDSARQRVGTGAFATWEDPTADPSRRMVLYKETYIRVDKDGDGIAELRRVCHVGNTFLYDKEHDLVELACGTSVLMPHKHLGISVYDLIKDLAQIKTVLLRSYLDNRYLQNNVEKIVNIDAFPSLDDFLTSRPGGIKRAALGPNGNVTAHVMPLVVPDTGAGALQALEYLDTVRENRTGYTKTAQGLDSESLASDTYRGQMLQMNQSQMRLEMIARTIAETLVRDLFRIVHALTLKHARKAEVVRLRNKWVTVDPRQWVRRTDLSISVGLGANTGQQQIQNLMLIGQSQQQAMPLGLVTPLNIYNTLSKLAVAAGFKNAEEFYTPPQQRPKIDPQTGQPVIGQDGKPEMESAPPPQQPTPEEKVAQIKAQSDQQITKMKMQGEGQLEGMRVEKQQAVELAQAQADVATQQHKVETERQLELQKFQMQLQADELRHQREQETQVQLANIRAANALEIERVRTGVERGDIVLQQELIDAGQQAAANALNAVRELGASLMQVISGPKEIVRGPDGRAIGIKSANGATQKVARGPDGRVTGLQ